MIRVKRGLELPLDGQPGNEIREAPAVKRVGITGPDFAGMRPSLLVRPGDKVKTGQPVFQCKKNEGLVFTSPGAGTVGDIQRGEKRVFQTLTIDLDGEEQHHSFASYKQGMGVDDVDALRALLVESGMWTRIRERPFDKTPAVSGGLPKDIFVSLADTNPLAPNPLLIIYENLDDFEKGLEVLHALAERHLYICRMEGQNYQSPDLPKKKAEFFRGPHPAGTVGTQMHYLSPPTLASRVWYVGYQDVVAMGYLLRTGQLMTERFVGVGGPVCKEPTILKTRFGAEIAPLVSGLETLESEKTRTISGSIFNGRKVDGPFQFLGTFHNQVSMLEEDRERELLGWHMPGFNRFSVKNVFLSSALPMPKFRITTSTHGSKRALVPFGHFEKVCPFDMLPTQLLRALMVKDTDAAQQLGALELGEEDMSLFTFVSTGKTDFGPILRDNLDLIEKEG